MLDFTFQSRKYFLKWFLKLTPFCKFYGVPFAMRTFGKFKLNLSLQTIVADPSKKKKSIE